MKLTLLTALLVSSLAALPTDLHAAGPDLSTITSRADLDAVLAATTDVGLKQALADHAAAILAAAEQHRHVEAVIRTIEKSPGSFTKINTTPESLKKATRGELQIFDTLTAVNTSILNGHAHQNRKLDEDPYDAAFIEHLGRIDSLDTVAVVLTKLEESWLDPPGVSRCACRR
jgi:hypothetical protein